MIPTALDQRNHLPTKNPNGYPLIFLLQSTAAARDDETKTIRRYWTDLKPEARADMCQACGACEALCPQHIHIIDDLVQVTKDIPHP